jgi:hypothetical protein
MMSLPVVVTVAGSLGLVTAPRQIAGPIASCAPAGSGIRIEARPTPQTAAGITYRVENRRDTRVRWVRIGEGGGATMSVPVSETPSIASPPVGWRSRTDRDNTDDRVAFFWEAEGGAALPRGTAIEFAVIGRSRRYVRQNQVDAHGNPLLPIDFGSLPFSAGAADGACWWGRTSSTWDLPEGGYWAGMRGVTIRAFRPHDITHVIVDFPMADAMLRLSDKPFFLTIPLALSFGLAGGFSADASIGAGLTWAPTRAVSLSAGTRIGTFFFNNRTHVRTVGLDVHVPLQHFAFTEVKRVPTKHLTIGIEYFDRDVVRWLGFMDGAGWYASGRGIGIRVGIREIGWSK